MKDLEKKAKMKVLQEMRQMATDMMKEGLSPKKEVKKVTVASDSKEGLLKGLEKAEEVLDSEDEEDAELEDEETSEEDSDVSEMDEAECDAEIERLMKLKAKLSK